MSTIDPQNAIVQMYEDMSLTDAMTDDVARVVHQWGEAQIKMMANRMDNETAFEEKVAGMRGVLGLVNKFIDKRDKLDDERQRKYIRLLVERAQEAGYPAPFDAVGQVVDAQKTLDDHLTVRALLTMIETGRVSAGSLPDQADTIATRDAATLDALSNSQTPDSDDALDTSTFDAVTHDSPTFPAGIPGVRRDTPREVDGPSEDILAENIDGDTDPAAEEKGKFRLFRRKSDARDVPPGSDVE